MTMRGVHRAVSSLRLGRDHLRYGDLACEDQAEGRTVSAICVGSSPLALTVGQKALHGIANEDALLAIDAGDRTLMAVADAHFGPEAAEDLLAGLRTTVEARGIPAHSLELMERIRRLSPVRPDSYASETTLLVAVVDRGRGTGFGVSYGDSSLWAFRPGSAPRILSAKNDRFVSPLYPESLDPRRASECGFRVGEGDLVVALTDGVDECHYRRPETSVKPEHVARLWATPVESPEAWVRAVGELALRGVGGHPGGQDNLAVIATRC